MNEFSDYYQCIDNAAVVAAVSGVTYAFFTDSGTSTANAFSAGNLDLKLTDANETAQDTVSGTWSLTNAKPGDTFSGDLKIKNGGNVPGSHLNLGFANSLTEGSGAGAIATIPLSSVIKIDKLEWDNDANSGTTPVNLLSSVTDANHNGIIDLQDLEAGITGADYSGTQGTDHLLHMEGEFDPTLTIDQHQGDQDSMTLTATLTQN